jgi:iron-sulfur cluster assembly accessory protein
MDASRVLPYLLDMDVNQQVALTPAAAARVAAIAARQGKAAILRLSVEGGGCAGFQYRFGLADQVEPDDKITTQDGVTLVVDETSLELVRGSAVDYVESLGGAAFQVTNPNAASGCGCGTSFSV